MNDNDLNDVKTFSIKIHLAKKKKQIRQRFFPLFPIFFFFIFPLIFESNEGFFRGRQGSVFLQFFSLYTFFFFSFSLYLFSLLLNFFYSVKNIDHLRTHSRGAGLVFFFTAPVEPRKQWNFSPTRNYQDEKPMITEGWRVLTNEEKFNWPSVRYVHRHTFCQKVTVHKESLEIFSNFRIKPWVNWMEISTFLLKKVFGRSTLDLELRFEVWAQF